MVKLTFCLKRKSGMSREEFQRYWLDVHGPLVRSHAKELRIRRYVQMHSATVALNQLLRASRGAPEEYDGVAELWWDSIADLEAVLASPDGAEAGAALLEDEKQFIDLSASPLWLGEEKPIYEVTA